MEFAMKNYGQIITQESFAENLDRSLLREVMLYASRNVRFLYDNYDFHYE